MKKHLCLIVLLLCLFPVAAWAGPEHIVSLTPVGTEIAFALGQGKNIAADTTFCDYPPEAAKKKKIGGYVDVSLESLIAMKADLLLLSDIHMQMKDDLDRLGIPYVYIMQGSLNEVYDSIMNVGRKCGEEQKAAKLVAKMKREIAAIHNKVKGLPKKKAVLCVSRELSDENVSVFYAAGRGTFYNELLTLAGGENAVKPGKVQYPKMTGEGLSALDPDVIIDMVGERQFYHAMERIDMDRVFNEKYLKGQWQRGVKTKASRNGRIYILQGTVYLRPGPRIAQILRAFAKAVHPEAKL